MGKLWQKAPQVELSVFCPRPRALQVDIIVHCPSVMVFGKYNQVSVTLE